MKIPALNTLKLGSFLTRLQFLCLFLAGILEFASVALVHSITYQLLYWILPVLVCVFCITVIIQICKTQTPPPLIPIVVMVVWFFIIQLFPDVKQITLRNYGLFLSVYLLAFPFAMITQDEDRQLGLKMIATFYVAIALTLICYAVLLFANCVPGFLKDNFFWDNARLYVMVHPNVFARVLLISIACCLGACIHTSDKRLKVLLLATAALMFFVQALTNSRAAVLLTCLLAAGTVFFGIHNGTWKRFLLGAVAGLAVFAMLHGISQGIFQWNQTRLTSSADTLSAPAQQISVDNSQSPSDAQSMALELTDTDDAVAPPSAAPEENTRPVSASNQGSLLDDLPTLNNRTKIWAAVLRAIKDDPSILLWGADSSRKLAAQAGGTHTHNAWLEVLCRLGLPGLIMSLFFTAQAVWASFRLLFCNRVSLWKKIVSMLLCLLVLSMLEPSLFFTAKKWHFVDFFFFLCLGYALLWQKQLPKIKSSVNH